MQCNELCFFRFVSGVVQPPIGWTERCIEPGSVAAGSAPTLSPRESCLSVLIHVWSMCPYSHLKSRKLTKEYMLSVPARDFAALGQLPQPEHGPSTQQRRDAQHQPRAAPPGFLLHHGHQLDRHDRH